MIWPENIITSTATEMVQMTVTIIRMKVYMVMMIFLLYTGGASRRRQAAGAVASWNAPELRRRLVAGRRGRCSLRAGVACTGGRWAVGLRPGWAGVGGLVAPLAALRPAPVPAPAAHEGGDGASSFVQSPRCHPMS